MSLAERDLLAKEGKIQAEAPPVRKERRIDPETGDEMMVVGGIAPSWDFHAGKEAWRYVCIGCERKANQLSHKISLKATEKWVGSIAGSPALGQFVKNPPPINSNLALPIAAVTEIEERLRASKGIRLDRDRIDRVLKKVRACSPVLVLKASVVWKQKVSRKNQDFPWTEYQNMQSLLRKAEYFGVEEVRESIRLVGIAKHNNKGYPIILDFEAKTKRSSLVTLFTLGGKPSRWSKFKRSQLKRIEQRSRQPEATPTADGPSTV